jgi:hypothetical protein
MNWFKTCGGCGKQHFGDSVAQAVGKANGCCVKQAPTAPAEKHDAGKPRFSLLPIGAVRSVVKVLEFGAAKYAPDAWQGVPDARRRYYDAAMRHLDAYWSGERDDSESGLPHLAHAACCVLFLLWFSDKEAK